MKQTDLRVSFETKKLEAIQTLAELLVHAREQSGKTVADAAQVLQISPLYIEALESGEYQKLPCYVYTRNFVKKYGKWLKLNLKSLVETFDQEWQLFTKMQTSLPLPEKQTINRTDFWKMPRWFRWVGASLVVTAMLSYLGHELYSLRQAPMLVVDTPQEEMVTDRQLVQITGATEPEVEISINQQTILSDSDGNFSEMVALQPGLNLIEVSAKKKYSDEATVYRKIIVDQNVFTQAPGHEG